jgi:5-methyltetrahydrofolate--homocysteine methyltransferase
MISMTLTDSPAATSRAHGRGLLGSVRHAKPVTIGSIARSARPARPHLARSRLADTLVMAYPNAGLPNELANMTSAAETAAQVANGSTRPRQHRRRLLRNTPAHIAAIAGAARVHAAHVPAAPANPPCRPRADGDRCLSHE